MTFGAGIGVFGQNGIDGGENAGEEQAYGELTGSKSIERRRQGLEEKENASQDQGIAHGFEESVVLSEASPEGGRDGAGKSAERKDET